MTLEITKSMLISLGLSEIIAELIFGSKNPTIALAKTCSTYIHPVGAYVPENVTKIINYDEWENTLEVEQMKKQQLYIPYPPKQEEKKDFCNKIFGEIYQKLKKASRNEEKKEIIAINFPEYTKEYINSWNDSWVYVAEMEPEKEYLRTNFTLLVEEPENKTGIYLEIPQS